MAAANHSGLQMNPLRNLLFAWVLTLPVCVILGASTLAAALYVVSHVLGLKGIHVPVVMVGCKVSGYSDSLEREAVVSVMVQIRRIDRPSVMCERPGCGSEAEFVVESESAVRSKAVPIIAAKG
jgi:hypothetical protein